MKERFIDMEEHHIARDVKGREGRPVLMDCEYDIEWEFPEGWTDEQIKEAMQLANKAYDRGYNWGYKQATSELGNAVRTLGRLMRGGDE